MANQDLVNTVKSIVALARSGNLSEAYNKYRELFASPVFATYRPEDQRQTLRFMILAKNVPSTPTPEMVEAHRAAVAPLKELVATSHEPADYEMLGICYVLTGQEEEANRVFREGLALERQRDPQSDLCGSFMKRISLL